MSIVILITFFLFSYGVASVSIEYDARKHAEALSGLISLVSNSNYYVSETYYLPRGKCSVTITEDSVKVTIPRQVVEEKVKIETETVSELQLIYPIDVKIIPANFECDRNLRVPILIEKLGKEVRFSIK